MLRRLKHLFSDRLGALDGEIGPVKDFYFDDRSWAVRYLIADTGSWLTERKVLIPPQVIGRLEPSRGILHVELTRQQIVDSPSIDTHKTVSRQFEEEYHRHFGWPNYWETSTYLGLDGYQMPVIPGDVESLVDGDVAPISSDDSHLRSALAMTSYRIQASDGPIGHVSDLLVDDQTWVITRLVVKTGTWFSGKEILVPTIHVRGVNYPTSTITVALTKREIEHGQPVDEAALEAEPVPVSTAAKLRPVPALNPATTTLVPTALNKAGTTMPGTGTPAPSVSEVAQLAYQLYIQEHRIHGHDLQHWFQSEATLREAARNQSVKAVNPAKSFAGAKGR